MATAKQLAALKKARAARKKNLAAKKPAAKRKAPARRKVAAKRKPVARKSVARKPAAKKRASNSGVVYAQKGGGTKYYYTGEAGSKALNSDRSTAKKIGYITAAKVAKSLINKVPTGYGIHFTGKKA